MSISTKRKNKKSMDPTKANWLRATLLPLLTAFIFTCHFPAFGVGVVPLFDTFQFQEDYELRGTILDENEEPLIGANIVLTGTTTGVSTDLNGKFSISVPEGTESLSVSYIGYISEVVPVTGQTEITIILYPSLLHLKDVVVVGYGESKKEDLTGAIASVSAKDLETTVNTSVEQALQGKVAGIEVSNNSGAPGSGISVRIRGTASTSLSNEPLYVVDGVPISGDGNELSVGFGWTGGGGGQTAISPLASINPQEIESIEVLKDASATAIYGSRGANGVVLITTKRGAVGQAQVTYSAYHGVQTRIQKIDVMELPEFAAYNNEFLTLTNQPIQAQFADPSLLGPGTDWQEEVFRDASIQNHQLTITGGSEKTKYAITGGYFKQEGIVIESGFQRGSLRLNLDTDINSWLKAGSSMSVSKTDEQIILNDDAQGVITTAIRQTPAAPVRNVDGTFSGSGDSPNNSSFVQNPVAVAVDRDLTVDRTRLLGNVFLEASFLENFKYRVELGGDFQSIANFGFLPAYRYDEVVNINDISQLREDNIASNFWILKNYLTFNRLFGEKHEVTLLVGHEAQRSTWDQVSALVRSLQTNDTQALNAGDPTTASVTGAGVIGNALESYFARANYHYMGRYYLTASLRRDGSSKFGPNFRYGNFYSFSSKWRLSEESFFPKLAFVDDLSLRAGYGETGNQELPSYTFTSFVTTAVNGLGSVVELGQFPNPDIRWEESKQSNFGLDLAFFQGGLVLSANYYIKKTDGALARQSPPTSAGTEGVGATSPPFANLGKIDNRGIELSLGYQKNFKNGLSYSNTVTFSRNRNKVIDLGENVLPLIRNVRDGGTFDITRTEEGRPIGSFYGYVVEGIFTDGEDLLNSAIPDVAGGINPENGIWLGDVKFKDLDEDGVITANDRTFIGDPTPDFIYGFNNNLSYKNFELNVYLQGVQGGDIFNFLANRGTSMVNGFANQFEGVNDRARISVIDPDGDLNDPNNWMVENPETDMPRLSPNDPNANSRISDRYIEDGSYLRIKNVKLAYTIPKKVFNNAIQNLRVYTSVQNLATFTKYSGLDPEIGSFNQDALLTNVDNGRYPVPRVFLVGVDVTF